MLEALVSGVVAIVLGIVGNILTPHVEEKLRLKSPKYPPKYQVIEPLDKNASDEELEAWRAQNKRKLELFWWQVYVYGLSFFFMYMAIRIPMGLDSVNLSSTRLNFDLTLNGDKLSLLSSLLAILLYIPCWFAAQKIADFVTAIVLRYSSVNEMQYGAFVGLSMFFIAFLVEGHFDYLLNPSHGYIESIVLPFGVLFFVGTFASSRR